MLAARILATCAWLFIVAGIAHARGLETLSDKGSGRMYAIRVTPPSATAGTLAAKPAPASLRATADDFIAAHRELIGIEAPARDLVPTPATTDRLGLSRVRYLQTHGGLDVLGCEVAVHLNRDGQVTYVKTKVARELPAETTPRFTEAQAQDAALDAAVSEGASLEALMIHGMRLLVLPLGVVRNEPSEGTHLAWEVVVVDAATGGERLAEAQYVDAMTGAHLLRLSLIQHCDAVTRQIADCAAQGSATCQLNVESTSFPGYFHGRSEGQPARGPYPEYPGASVLWGSTDVDTLYELAGRAHDWVSTTFGINGANGFGGLARYPNAPAQLTRAAGNPDLGIPGGPICPGSAIFGLTYGTIYICRGFAVHDVFGHEYAHGIVFHSFHDGSGNPVGSTYYGQSGALNEGFADVIGEVFEHAMTGSTDWKDGTAPPFFSPSRDLAHPPSINRQQDGLPFPDRFNDGSVYCGSLNSGGVHMNSTIPSHAFYLISEGGTHNGCSIAGHGKDVAIQIFFRGWRTYFSSNPTFNEAYTDLIQACNDLYPSNVCAEVTRALQACEMDQPGLCSGIPATPPPCSVVGVGARPAPGVEGIRLLGEQPAHGTIRFAYRTARDGRVEARIHDLAGRRLARPLRAYQLAGDQLGAWDGRLENGERASAGAYFLSVTLDGQPIGMKKLLLIR